MLKIGLDLDDTLNYWLSEYNKLYKNSKSKYEITKNVYKLRKNKEFWMNLPIKNSPNFIPELFCTKRIIPKSWTKEYLKKNLIPIAPIYQQWYQYGKKSTLIKGRVDVFIDDSIENMIELNLAGIPCLLMDAETNQEWEFFGRVFSLDYNHIEETYNLFMEQIFPNFKSLIDEIK